MIANNNNEEVEIFDTKFFERNIDNDRPMSTFDGQMSVGGNGTYVLFDYSKNANLFLLCIRVTTISSFSCISPL